MCGSEGSSTRRRSRRDDQVRGPEVAAAGGLACLCPSAKHRIDCTQGHERHVVGRATGDGHVDVLVLELGEVAALVGVEPRDEPVPLDDEERSVSCDYHRRDWVQFRRDV